LNTLKFSCGTPEKKEFCKVADFATKDPEYAPQITEFEAMLAKTPIAGKQAEHCFVIEAPENTSVVCLHKADALKNFETSLTFQHHDAEAEE